MKVFLAIGLSLTLLAGCATHVKNKAEAKLMPESVAKQILAKHLGYAWAQKSTGFHGSLIVDLLLPCGWKGLTKPIPFPYNEMNHVIVIGKYGHPNMRILIESHLLKIYVPCKFKYKEFVGSWSEQDINDIIDALVSLGAKIRESSKE